MKQNDFYEVDGCIDFIPVKLIEEHKHMTNTLEVELTQTGYKTFVPIIYSFPKANEPQKPVVPKFVAEWIEEARAEEYSLYGAWEMVKEGSEIFWWLFDGHESNQDTFNRAWLDGYEIEQEKLYTVEIPNPHSYIDNHSRLARNYKGKVVLEVQDWLNTFDSYKLTESEIKKDFEWAWQWAKEAEDE